MIVIDIRNTNIIIGTYVKSNLNYVYMKTKINDTKKTRDNDDINFKDIFLISVDMLFLLFINFSKIFCKTFILMDLSFYRDLITYLF